MAKTEREACLAQMQAQYAWATSRIFCSNMMYARDAEHREYCRQKAMTYQALSATYYAKAATLVRTLLYDQEV